MNDVLAKDPLRLSVVIATYNRPVLLSRLLGQLAGQTLAPEAFEVVVVDDGSREPVASLLATRTYPFALRVETQANAGAAAARHRGILAATGERLVLVDDDMQVRPDFLEAHLAAHPAGTRRAVLGGIQPPPEPGRMPVYERWHQRILEDFAARCRAGTRPRGNEVYTGNLSLRRDDYLAAGGFDVSLGHSEDAELGLRLEEAGVEVTYRDEPATINGSDHASLARWRRRSELYGIFDSRIAAKHPRLAHASPWRFWPDLRRISRPILLGTALVPPLSRLVAAMVAGVSMGCAALGLERLALAGTTLAYGIDYYRGVRLEAGSAGAFLAARRAALRALAIAAPRPGRWRTWREALRADHAMVRHYEDRYGHHSRSSGRWLVDVITKVGLQELAAIRWMRLVRDLHVPLGAKITSRLIRHLYGSDVHWDAELAPGIVLVHGFGLAISHAARVGPGCILFQNVCLGMGIDPSTRQSGAPTLEANVHVGPGATLLGPITVGEGSKVMAGVTLTSSVPPGSVVEAVVPSVRRRAVATGPATAAGEPGP